MQRIIASLVVCLWWMAPAKAESALVDWSKPMTGESRYTVNSDGSTAKMGSAAGSTVTRHDSGPQHSPEQMHERAERMEERAERRHERIERMEERAERMHERAERMLQRSERMIERIRQHERHNRT
jgi:hypothetical protein